MPVACSPSSVWPAMLFALVGIISARSAFLGPPRGRQHRDPGRSDRSGAARDRTDGGGLGGGPILSIAPAPGIIMHADATDMRKSFTALCWIIRGDLSDEHADGPTTAR
jgi:hypothetical protein